jgi:hypothetical protein
VSHPLQDLAQRRLELVERSTAQRAAVVSGVEPLLHKAAALDRMVASARRHPVVTVLGAAAVALLASRKVFDLATRVLAIYALFKR